ncbi:O-phospho-L-seryl-tRNA:Cys-tRNA synthase [Methanohalophilus halophilus]|uniref:O-phospho-L-seryl-tRNA:Cys-tRNA synthase n=1 Tax=Methanohalophilus halophilus TaxID=2177 RepID=A0A1L3Q0A4_9EURY|nr:O-phospho-L-seryl-tRNA:Cys-tRNA synthase [Methanohalophilus halophilus]APH38304.1 O-phospho-L-seryl-tRNA:Cys-tRNA synthase [Methanohalophilus halophilus]RNI10827.1 O-phospho-L-seryl-tRNA:Cys-tRNA synthase [Methanohalophilus halophilus]SDW01838.1 Sep-tRNA:Cys-tRNA synthase [Methanohalophilus halophilus]
MKGAKDHLIEKTFEALFELEDMREIIRRSLPNGMSAGEEDAFMKSTANLKSVIEDLEKGTSEKQANFPQIVDRIGLRYREEGNINIQPIQAAGRLTPEARKALISYGDGYSTCDSCRKPFRLDKISRPPIADFHEELASFVNMDTARVVPGARRGFQAVTSSLVGKDDSVIVSSLAHYTEFLAVEAAGGKVREIPLDGENKVDVNSMAEKIEDVIGEDGKNPSLMMIDHYDYQYANEHDIKSIASIAHDYDIPVLYNGAYTVGVMPVDGKKLGADFVVGSGHKSMASPAPSGILATTDEYSDLVFRTTRMKGDVTGRKFGIKEVEMMGCTLMGGTLLAMMASFPHVKKRTQKWDEQVRNSNRFMEEFLKIEGNKVISEYPRRHTLTKVDTTQTFDKVAKEHKRRGFFLSDELSQLGVVGMFPGATRAWKLNTYGLSREKIDYLSDAFKEIAVKYNLNVN